MRFHLIVPALALAVGSALAAPAPAQTPRPGGGMGLPRTTAEVQAWSERLFTRLDASRDGAVTGDELAVLTGPQAAARGGSRLRAMVARSDASGDARISREELAAGAQRMFERMDRNGDGRLAEDELPRPAARPAPVQPPIPDPMPTFPETPPDGG
jgi:Ca2+-binding EF-hand superfamily protein